MKSFIPIAKPIIGDDERAAVDRVMRTANLSQGPEVEAFELEFAERFQLGRACVAVNSGTSGLHIGLLAAGVGPGHEVIIPSFTFAATANAVALTGAVPIFADIDPHTFCITAATVAPHITDRTVGIMAVHLYGHPADVSSLHDLAIANGLQLFEDAAQAHGATTDGVPVGTFGTFGVFSLYPTKNMTSGEGGMVVAGDSGIERQLRLYRNQGMLRRYENEVVGLNNRMTDLHAAIGRVQLTKIDTWTELRQRNARYLSDNLIGVVVPPVTPGVRHVFHQYTIRVSEDRDGLAQALQDEFGIGTGLFYPTPVHRLSPFECNTELPETERAARECLSLPVHPSVAQADLEHIVTAVNTLVKAGS